jgi:hypothetical protein
MTVKVLIYSQQASGFIRGKAYANPRYFSTPRAGVEKVQIVGDWPNIRRAYEALKVPVEQIDLSGAVAEPSAPADAIAAPPSLTPVAPEPERAAIDIPEDWQSLSWPQLRRLAASFSPDPIINKGLAVAAITAELARRG